MARVEQQPLNKVTEQQLLEGEVLFSKTLTLRELLGIKPGEEGETENLLNDVPFDFEVRDLGDSLLYTASFSETQPVSLWELHPLLAAAKPGGISRQARQDRNMILADWRIILSNVRDEEPESAGLYDFHKEHVPGFIEFEENHFELFYRVLLETNAERSAEVAFFNRQLSKFIDEREFLAKYGRQHDFSSDSKIDYVPTSFCSLGFLKAFLEKKGFKLPPTPRGDSDLYSDLYNETRIILLTMDKKRKRALSVELYKQLVDEEGVEKEREIGLYMMQGQGSYYYPILIGENDELNIIGAGGALKPLDVFINQERSEGFGQKPDSFKRLDSGQIELKKGESFIKISIIEGKDGYKKVKLEDQHLTTTVEAMIPIIVWQKDKQTGKRSYYCGKFDELPGHDTLLGQLIVAAYSPEARDQMPREITIRDEQGRKRTQEMLEGQSVLLVPMFAQRFLQESPVILGLEALAKT